MVANPSRCQLLIEHCELNAVHCLQKAVRKAATSGDATRAPVVPALWNCLDASWPHLCPYSDRQGGRSAVAAAQISTPPDAAISGDSLAKCQPVVSIRELSVSPVVGCHPCRTHAACLASLASPRCLATILSARVSPPGRLLCSFFWTLSSFDAEHGLQSPLQKKR